MALADIDEILDLIGFGRMQVLMVIACSVISIVLASEIMGISVVAVNIACEFSMSDNQLSLLSSAAFAGLIVASHYSGYKTDRIGRRKIILFSLCLAVVSSLISLAMPSFYYFLFWRFMTGLFISGASANNVTYLTEFTKVKLRTSIVNVLSYAFACGSICLPSVAYLLAPLHRTVFSMGDFNVRVWRFNMLLNLVPGLIAIALMWVVPESAKFRLSVGDSEGAYKTLNRLCQNNRKTDLKSLGVTGITEPDPPENKGKPKNCCQRVWRDTKPLFKQPHARNLCICTTVLCGFFAVGNSMALWFVKLRHLMHNGDLNFCEMIERGYAEANLNQNSTSTVNILESDSECSKNPPNFIDSIVLGCTLLCCCICGNILLCFIRRIYILFILAILSTICGFSLNLLTSTVSLLVAMAMFSSACCSCFPLMATLICDVVPTHLRGKAINLSFMFSRLSVIFANIIISSFMISYCLITSNFFVLITLALAISTYFLPNI